MYIIPYHLNRIKRKTRSCSRFHESSFSDPRQLPSNPKFTELHLKRAGRVSCGQLSWNIFLAKSPFGNHISVHYQHPTFSVTILILSDIVPKNFNLPISWNEQDKAFLRGTGVLESIGEPEQDFKKNFLKISKVIT